MAVLARFNVSGRVEPEDMLGEVYFLFMLAVSVVFSPFIANGGWPFASRVAVGYTYRSSTVDDPSIFIAIAIWDYMGQCRVPLDLLFFQYYSDYRRYCKQRKQIQILVCSSALLWSSALTPCAGYTNVYGIHLLRKSYFSS